MARIVAAGGRLHTGSEPIAFRPGVVDLFFAQDPEGNFLEFVQRNEPGHLSPAGRPGAAGLIPM